MKRIFAALLLLPLTCSAYWFSEEKPSYDKCILKHIKSGMSDALLTEIRRSCEFEVFENLDKLEKFSPEEMSTIEGRFSLVDTKYPEIHDFANWFFYVSNQSGKSIKYLKIRVKDKTGKVTSHGFFARLPPFQSANVKNRFSKEFFDDVENWWFEAVYY